MSNDNVSTDEQLSAHSVTKGSWRELFSKDHAAASLVLAGGIAIYAMNMFITASLLPSTVADIGGEQYFAWVTTAFLVASVLTSMLVARVLGAWGAARAYLLAFALFADGSMAAALSPTMEVLIGARVVQGLGGGLLAGLGYSVIPNALPRHLWTRATGLVSAMWGFGTLVGPAIGGLFAQAEMWRGAFWLLTVVALALGLTALRGLPRHTGQRVQDGPLPLASLGLLVLSAAAFSTASVTSVGWPTSIALTMGVVLVAGFVFVDKAATAPVLPRFTYRRGNSLKWIYLVLGILSSAAMVEMFLPKFGQDLVGMPPVLAGMFGVTVSIGWSFVQLLSSSVDNPRTRRFFMLVGPVLVTAGLTVFAATQHLDGSWAVWLWVGGLVLAGAGIGLAFPHLNVAAMSSSDDPREGSKAAAGLGTAELIANSIASALVGVLVAVGGPGAAGSATMGAGLAVLGAIGIVFAVMIVRRISLR